MALFTINEDLCARDGLCAADCPLGCIALGEDGLPEPHEQKAAYCIQCGHCMAVCPTNALQLDCFDSPAVARKRDAKISREQAEQFLKERRSVRAFRDEPVDRELLAGLLDLTEYAPSGHNSRPVRWAVADSKEAVRRVTSATVEWMRREVEADSEAAGKLHLAGIVRLWDKGVDLICRDAPALAVPYVPVRGITQDADGVIALSYLELAAHGAGLGACWCGYVYFASLQDEGVCEVLGIPPEHRVSGALLLGRAARRYRSIPPRNGAEVQWL